MNHKHIMVVIEDLVYSGTIDVQTAIDDLVDYTECVERGELDKHYEHCLNVETKEL